MLLTGQSTDKSSWLGSVLQEVASYRDRFFEPRRMVSPWTLNAQAKGVVLPATAVVTYLTFWLLLQSIAPDLHLLPGQWSWNLAGGLSFGFLIGFGLAYLPVVFLAHLFPLFGEASAGIGTLQGIALAVGTTAVYGLACHAARRALSAKNIDLEDRSMLAIVLVLVPFTALAAALVTALGWWLAGLLSPNMLVDAVLVKAFGNGMGLLAVSLFVPLNGIPLLNSLVERSTSAGFFRPLDWPVRDLLLGAGLLLVTAAASIAAFGGVDGDRFDVYLLVFVPLLAMGLRFGLRGLAGSLLVLGCVRAAVTVFQYSAEPGFALEATVLSAVLSSLIVASLATETERRQRAMQSQSALMDAVSHATDRMLRTTDQEKDVNEVLRHLMNDIDATRLYVLENQHEENQAGRAIHYEQSKSGADRDTHLEEMLGMVRTSLISQNKDLLSRGEVLQCGAMELSRRDRSVWEAFNVEGSIVLPIFADGRWWGCLGVDRSSNSRWSHHEISALKATGAVLGSLLAHANIEQQFKQLTGNIPVVFWIGQPNGLKKTYVSPAFEEIWELSTDLIHNNPQAWLGAIHHEDYSRIHDELPKQQTGKFDVEYRVVAPSGTVRWVRDTAFPVCDTAGKVNRIVGIAQNITRQKEAEERVRATTFLLKSLIDNLGPAILVEDGERNVRHANKSFCDMFAVEAPGEALTPIDSFMAPSTVGLHAEGMEEIVQAGSAHRRDEIVSDDGRIFSRDYTPLMFDDGDLYHLWSFEDITNRRHNEQQIQASLEEKEILLKEIHHRVKNNLQVISSLLNLQASRIGDDRTVEAFRDSQSRVKAMALVHERLYQSSDLARIDFGGYVKEVTRHLMRSYSSRSSRARMHMDIEPVALSIDTAIPCGLITNELISNSLKYAFPEGRSGNIQISLSQDDRGTCQLSIADDGIGFPAERFEEAGDSLGLQLVRSLVAQLDGDVQYSNGDGAKFVIEFRPMVERNQDLAKTKVELHR
jgi:PAS domain S-box-containing protein